MIINTGKTIKEMRARKKWHQERILDMFSDYAPVIHRLEKGELLPGTPRLHTIFTEFGVPMYELLCPYEKGQPMDVYAMKYELEQLTDDKYLEDSAALFAELDKVINKKNPLNLQFMLSQEAKILEMQNKPPKEIMPLVTKALLMTIPDMGKTSPGSNLLILEEPELFFTLARLQAADGNVQEAIRILKQTCEGINRQPTGQRQRDRKSARILLQLSRYIGLTGSYDEAIFYCDQGIETSTKRSLGKEVPELLQLKAELMMEKGDKQASEGLLKQAYAGFLMLGEKTKSSKVLAAARNTYKMEFETYGMERLDITDVKLVPYKRGPVPMHDTVGELIRELRLDAGLSIKKLCHGICSVPTLSKIENGETHGHMHYVEPLLERLGRDPLLHVLFFLNKEDFVSRELMDEANQMIIQAKYTEAAELIEVLKSYRYYEPESKKGGLNYQSILAAEISLFVAKNTYAHPDVEKMVLDALKLSIPKFDEEDIKGYYLALTERILIGHLAAHYLQVGSLRKSANIYNAISLNESKRIADEFELARTYATNCFNYSTCLGRMERRYEALEVIYEALVFTRSRKRLTTTPNLMANKAYNLMKQGKKEESLAYFAMAFYGFQMFANSTYLRYMDITQNIVQDSFGVEFY